jgi:hypothetical protein
VRCDRNDPVAIKAAVESVISDIAFEIETRDFYEERI